MRSTAVAASAAFVVRQLSGVRADRVRRRIGILFLCLLSITAGLSDRRTTIVAAGPRPNVAITRIPGTAGLVWAADVNRDGKTDLIASRPHSLTGIALRLGTGDGTFGEERIITTPAIAAPLGAADLDGDGHLDVIAVDWSPPAGEEEVVGALGRNFGGTVSVSIL
jgi:hypothetical protein